MRMLCTVCVVACYATLVVADQIELQPRGGGHLNGLTAEQLAQFEQGRIDFDTNIGAPEGLGPVFNQTSCGACHNDPDIGGAGTSMVTRFGEFTKDGFDPLAHLGGSLLKAFSVQPEGFPDGFCQEFLPSVANVVTNRVTPSSLGIGLIEAIEEADIIALEAAQDGLPTAGRIHWVEMLEDPEGPLRVGKFGWKNQLATVLSFSADASQNELGLSNRLLPFDNPPMGDPDLLAICDLAPVDPEDGPDENGLDLIDRITFFQAFLAAPPQTPRSGTTGESIFVNIGCADCHVASAYVTGTVPGVPALSGKIIKPYSDFLLHNMGTLGDGIEQGSASGLEFRTPPLWGLRFRKALIHDPVIEADLASGDFGVRVRAAINAHDRFGSQGAPSAQNFLFGLSNEEQDAMINFLYSLGQGEFDFAGGPTADGDTFVESDDMVEFIACLTGPGAGTVSPEVRCAIGDIDQNGSIDLIDIAGFFRAISDNPLTDGI